MLPSLQKWMEKVLVVDLATIRDLIDPESNPLYGQDDFKNPAPLAKEDIGAIISIEDRLPVTAGFQSGWRLSGLSPEKIAGIAIMFTQVFFSDENITDPLIDLLLEFSENAVRQRSAALAETLDFADRFFLSSENQHKKLIIHCTHGRHRSPVLMLAVMLHQFPETAEEEALANLYHIGLKEPRLRTGELAFIDAFMGRDGKLIRAWEARAGKNVFNMSNSLRLHQTFCRILRAQLPDGKYAPADRRGVLAL